MAMKFIINFRQFYNAQFEYFKINSKQFDQVWYLWLIWSNSNYFKIQESRTDNNN
jgi:hypothetical protein